MPTYYTTRAEIDRLLRPGQKVQFRKGRGYYLGGQPSGAAPVDPVTQQATSSVEAALAPLLASIERQREDARQQAERERAQLAQYYQWAAGEARNIGPAIGGAYNQAAQTTGAFSKGFSQGMQDALAGNAAEANKLLEQNGAPAGQMLGGRAAPAADALYGLSGALPAQEISAQGAAFSSAAAQLPMTAAGIGGQSLQKMLEEQSAVEKQFADAILEIEQKRPGLIQDAVNELKELALAERNQKLKEAAYEFETGLKVTDMNRKLRNDEFSQAARRESLAQGRDRIAIQKYNADLARIRADRSYQLGLDRLGIQEEGLRLRAAELDARLRQSKGKNKKKGFTPDQLRKVRGIAGTIARNAFSGFTDGDGVAHPKIGYQEAVRIGLDEGVPLAILLPALNRYYRRGQRGRPYAGFYERQRAQRASRAKPRRG